MFLQNGHDDLLLDADPPSVDDPDLAKSLPDGLIEVFLNDGPHLPRLESVEVDRVLDRYLVHCVSIMGPDPR